VKQMETNVIKEWARYDPKMTITKLTELIEEGISSPRWYYSDLDGEV